ncbi:MAG: substrate-binding domain-containing protein [Chloroflexota bacterium]
MSTRNFAALGTLVALALVLSACGGPAVPQAPSAAGDSSSEGLRGTIAVSGAFALYPMMTVWAEEFSKLHPDVAFDVQGGGAGKGMTDTLAGAVDVGMISRGIRPEEEQRGAYWVAVAKDAVFPIVSAENPVLGQLVAKGIKQETFNGIFITGEIRTWGEVIGDPSATDELHLYGRSDSSGAADQWALFSGGKVQSDLLGIGVNGEPAHVDTVRKDPLGIGFSNLNSVFDPSTGNIAAGIVVVPIDINGNGQTDAGEYYENKSAAVQVVSDGTYPSPPARFENLATKGKPTGLVLAFIKWILTDGQQYLDAAGYVQLSPDQQVESLGKLK